MQMGQPYNLQSEHVVELAVACTESNSTIRGATHAGSSDVDADAIQPNINTSRFFQNKSNSREGQKKVHLQSSNDSSPLSASRPGGNIVHV